MERTKGKTEEQLKPCPFCGNNDWESICCGPYGTHGQYICDSCQARTPDHFNPKNSIKNANRRADGGLVGRENAKVLELLQKAREMLLGPLLIFDGQDLRCVEIFIKKAEAVLEKAGKL